jgi:dihydrofolate synthase/folylpolyglutamate synthase
MNFEKAMAYLYDRLPVFHKIGHRAYKPGLDTTWALCERLGNPQKNYATIHVAGTNGKGSVSNMLAAILQTAGFKTGLYTSPHLKSFNERIRVNGKVIEEGYVADFVTEHKQYIEQISPSFFEVTVAMAFDYFADQGVDIAVIEVGMGGRLDSTNVITPILSVITNIGLDHVRQLGDTLPQIAKEKAGIIKPGVPVVISERQSEEISGVFEREAAAKQASLRYGSDYGRVEDEGTENGSLRIKIDKTNDDNISNTVRYELDLSGNYQKKNVLAVLSAVELLNGEGWPISEEAVRTGLASVSGTTGFKGRWTRLKDRPFVVADTAHNLPGLQGTLEQFLSVPADQRHFVLGFVSDKDISSMLRLLPLNAKYYFCAPTNSRALPSIALLEQATALGLKGQSFPDVNAALEAALLNSSESDSIYVGGSTFVVADLELL